MSTINSLPDETITHILSFLPIKQAARTSVLAKRWRILFAFSPNLDVLEYKEDKLETFMDFVDRVLALSRNSPIKKFTLKCLKGFDEARINRWIHNVLNRGVLDLDLDLGLTKTDEYSLPVEVFTCKTIVNLKLTGIDIQQLPEDPSMPAIQWFFNTMFMDWVISGEELNQLVHDISEIV